MTKSSQPLSYLLLLPLIGCLLSFSSAERNTLSPPTKPRVFAVLVGVSEYNTKPQLSFCDDDAYQMGIFLRGPEGGSIPLSRMSVLIDQKATKNAILQAMRKRFALAGPDDLIIFYFSGHGEKNAIVPYDFDGETRTLLGHATLWGPIDSSRAGRKLIILDACFSGSAAGIVKNKNLEKDYHKFLIADAEEEANTALVMSSKGNEISVEIDGIRQGVFSYFLRKGMEGHADEDEDGIVTMDELFEYDSVQVVQYTKGQQHPMILGSYDEDMRITKVFKHRD